MRVLIPPQHRPWKQAVLSGHAALLLGLAQGCPVRPGEELLEPGGWGSGSQGHRGGRGPGAWIALGSEPHIPRYSRPPGSGEVARGRRCAPLSRREHRPPHPPATALGQRHWQFFIMTAGVPVPLIPHGLDETGETLKESGERQLRIKGDSDQATSAGQTLLRGRRGPTGASEQPQRESSSCSGRRPEAPHYFSV